MQTLNANNLINRNDNADTLSQFFIGIASGNFYDGTSYQLYLDLNDGQLITNHEATNSTWLQREDGSLAQILMISGYDSRSQAELYNDGCDLLDYGYAEWLELVEEKIEELLAK